MGNDALRIKQMNALLATLDAPHEGDEILFTIEGDPTKYRGTIAKKTSAEGTAVFNITTKVQGLPMGKAVATIEYRGKVFKTGGWKQL